MFRRKKRRDPAAPVGPQIVGDGPDDDAFATLVQAAVDGLPVELRREISNVQIVIEDEPPSGLPYLGLYVGVPLTRRTSWYAGVAPDKIEIYRGPLERLYGHDPQRLAAEVAHVVRH